MYPLFADLDGSSGSAMWGTAQAMRLLGSFHPLVVHFPIALLLTAAFLEAISVWKKNSPGLLSAIAFNLTLGTLAALVAATFGWLDAAHIGFEPDLQPVLAWHRWLGTTVAFGSLITTILWFRARTNLSTCLWLYRITLWMLALLVGITGHLGALLVYGLDYFSF
jgi:uncharacterized membrane protein